MSILTRIYSNTADTYATAPAGATYSTVRAATTSTAANTTATTGFVGQQFASPNYTIYQAFYQFDTSALSAGTSGSVSVFTGSAITLGDTFEVSQVSAITNKIAGASLSSLTQIGSAAMPASSGRIDIPLTGTIPVSATLRYLLSSQRERLNVAPTTNDRCLVYLADNTGTTNDPYLDVLTGTSWAYVGRGTSVEATATSHILTEPAGVAAGDLLVACIGSRIASVSAITLPSGWTRVADQTNNNTATNTSATPSGMMAYIIRGGSAPSYTFTHPVAPSVALGRVFAYRNVHQTTPFQDFQSATSLTNVLVAATVTGPAAADDNLIVALAVGGQEGTWSGFTSTTGTTSGTTADSVLDPQFGAWLERSDVLTATGSDVSMAVADYIHQTGAGTGAVSATTTLNAAQVMVVGSFRLAPTVPAGPTYDDDQDETLAAADTVAISQFERSGPIAETAASAETVAGLLDATRIVAETAAAAETLGGLLVTEKAIAETAAAVETIVPEVIPAGAIYDKDQVETASAAEALTGRLTFTGATAETAAAAETISKTLTYTGVVAETASAADTVGGLLVRIGAVAETASAAETVGSLLTFTGAVAESASAAETIVPDIIPAGGIHDKDQVETAAAADTVGGLLTYNVTVAETAAAAETITRAVSYTGAVAETASAADTVGGLTVRIGAVAESASAAETAAGLLTFTAAIAETASAAETIIPIVVPAGGTLYEETVLETLAALDEFSADVIRASGGGGIGHGGAGGGKRRRHLFIYENVPANDDDEEDEEQKPQPKRKLRLKKAEVEEKIEDAIAWIEAGSPRPMSQQALAAEVSAVLDIASLIEADRRRIERTIYRYIAALLAEQEEEEAVMLLLAA